MRKTTLAAALAAAAFHGSGIAAPTIGSCPVFPANNYWNTPVDTLPVHESSGLWVNTIGAATKLHPDWGNNPADYYGIPFVTVNGNTQPFVPILADPDPNWDYSDESDPGPYPVPPTAPIEGGPLAQPDDDKHVIVVDSTTCKLYELYHAAFTGDGNNSWTAASFAKYDLNSNALRTDGWTSADAAGLAIFPGLMRWEEVAAPGEIEHAVRFTANLIWAVIPGGHKYLWPARHWSGNSSSSARPPMGARFRLKASFNISGFSAPTQKILRAFKKYGLVLADGGSNWYISGTTDPGWASQIDGELKTIAGSNFEAVDASLLMVSPNSGQALVPTAAQMPHLANISTRMQVLTGNDVLIGGFVIGGSGSKQVAIVATGPSLTQYGITNALANPTLTLVRSSDQAVLATNDNWQTAGNAAALQAAGFAPSNSLESAILTTLPTGAYTAIVSGASGGTGVGVVGVYEVDHPEVPLVNISTRGQVLTGNDVMIGGFIISGNFPRTVTIVATGPSLSQYGITNPLANPTLTLVRSSDQAVLASNDDWQGAANAATIQASGFAPPNPLESAIHTTLAPGAYTAIVSGAGGGTGVGVIGVYVQ